MRWLVRAYLRTRLHKINTHAVDILDSDELKSRLSAAEAEYAQGYFSMLCEHARNTVTDRLKEGEDGCHLLRDADVRALLPRLPDSVVFCRLEADAGLVDLGSGVGCAPMGGAEGRERQNGQRSRVDSRTLAALASPSCSSPAAAADAPCLSASIAATQLTPPCPFRSLPSRAQDVRPAPRRHRGEPLQGRRAAHPRGRGGRHRQDSEPHLTLNNSE